MSTSKLHPAPAKTILVVDDDQSMRKFVGYLVKILKLRVVTAVDGMQALETITTTPVDLIITDLNMPNVNGFELIRTVRGAPDTNHIPIIVLSAYTSRNEAELGLELGADLFAIKPFKIEQLKTDVLRLLSAKESVSDV